MKGLQIAMVCGALCFAFGARAQLVTLSWTGTGAASGLDLSGGVNAIYNGSGDDETAISTTGYITITDNSAKYGGLAGQYTLVPNASTANMGSFYGGNAGMSQGYCYDDRLNLHSPDCLDSGGLLFIRSDGLVVNVCCLNGTTYITDSNEIPFNRIELLAGNLSISPGADPMKASAVPEPATMIAGSLMLVPLGLSALRRLRTTSRKETGAAL